MKHNILCLDDEASNNETIVRLLRKSFDVSTFEDPNKAIAELSNKKYSLILSDQKMPEMTGVEFLKISQKIQPEAIRILITGYSDLDTVIKAINEGQIYRYIAKPWEGQDFLQTINLSIETYQNRQILKQKNYELQNAIDKLAQLDQAKADFMSIINHELKTPLTSIINFTELLAEEKLTDTQKKYLKRIHENAERLNVLIEDTLLITSLRQGSLKDKKEKIFLDKKIKSFLTNSKSVYEKSNLTFSVLDCDIELNVEAKLIDAVLKQIFENIFKFAKSNSEIKITSKVIDSSWCELKFTNLFTGSKIINPEDLFSSFKKNENTKNHSKGLGLGLSMVKAICDFWGSDCNVTTTDTEFTLMIKVPTQ